LRRRTVMGPARRHRHAAFPEDARRARVKPQLLSMRSTSSFREVVGRAGQVISRRHLGWAAALGA
jgi:hypothetical protein